MSPLHMELCTPCRFCCKKKESSDKVGNAILSNFKGILAPQDFTTDSHTQRVNQINKIFTELQLRNRLGWVKDKGMILAQRPQGKGTC